MRINKRYIFLWVLGFGAILLSGCNTAGGVVKGFAGGLESVIENTGEGIGKDFCASGGFLKTLDDWIKENLW